MYSCPPWWLSKVRRERLCQEEAQSGRVRRPGVPLDDDAGPAEDRQLWVTRSSFERYKSVEEMDFKAAAEARHQAHASVATT